MWCVLRAFGQYSCKLRFHNFVTSQTVLSIFVTIKGVSAVESSSSPSAGPARSSGCFWDLTAAVVLDAEASGGS
jgi:hypothetical protein